MNSLCVPIFEAINETSQTRDCEGSNEAQLRESKKPRIKGGVFAREPFLNNLVLLNKAPPLSLDPILEAEESINPKENNRSIPTLVIYGDHDWLSYPEVESDIAFARDKFGVPIQLKVVENAGHHLYIENPKGFHEAIVNWKNR
jgi:pimeloyl-ACP methyl ester carboxylesterase